jgi:NADH-quinone oxidoreductase subunit B
MFVRLGARSGGAQWILLSVAILAAVLFVLLNFTLSRLVAPHNPEAKPFLKCGRCRSVRRTRFNVGYYVFALLFLIFEVEVVFLFPWAVSSGRSACGPRGRRGLPRHPGLRIRVRLAQGLPRMALNEREAAAAEAAQWENQDPQGQPPPRGGFVLTQIDRVLTWARTNSLWPLTFGTSCCAIEMMSVGASRHDWSRFGFEVARATPRQADMIVVAGTITFRWLPPRCSTPRCPTQVGARDGACATSGGPFFYEATPSSGRRGAPVDVYLRVPSPEALLHSLMLLQEKIRREGGSRRQRPLPPFLFAHTPIDPKKEFNPG